MFARQVGFVFAAIPLFSLAVNASPLVQDKPEHFGAIDAVCTGVGSAKDDDSWSDYPVRIEFSNRGAQFLAGEHVELSRAGRQIAQFDCSGPWILVKGEPGRYSIRASVATQSGVVAQKDFYLGNAQQTQVELQFSDVEPNQ